jgi:HK97 family phage major capsid protein
LVRFEVVPENVSGVSRHVSQQTVCFFDSFMSDTYAERNRITEIRAIAERLQGRIPNITEMADAAISRGDPIEAFRTAAMNCIPSIQPVRTAQPLDIRPKEWTRYSLSRAICQLANNRQLDGFEAEMHRETELRQGQRAQGFWVPPQVLDRSYVAGDGTAGGFIVSTPNLGDQFIPALRNKAKVISLGAKILNLDNPVTIPRQAGAGTVNWVTETTSATLSAGNFEQITLVPHACNSWGQYSKQLLATNNPSIDGIIRDDILQEIGLKIDLAALNGSGNAPTGLTGTAGVNSVALGANGLALGNATAYPALVSLESAIAADNADVASMGYIVRAGHRGALKLQQRFTNTDSPIWTSARQADGSVMQFVNGYRAEVTQQIPVNLTAGTATTICSAIFFGNWGDLIVAQFNGGATDLVVDPYTLAANAVVRVIAHKWVDIAARHGESFAILGGVLTN